MVADAFDDGNRAAVPHRETLAGHPADQSLAGRGAVQRDVAGHDVFFRKEIGGLRRKDGQPSSGQSLPEVVIRVAFQRQADPPWKEGAKTLAGGSGEADLDGVVGQAIEAVPARDFAAEDRADRPVAVPNRKL